MSGASGVSEVDVVDEEAEVVVEDMADVMPLPRPTATQLSSRLLRGIL